MGEYAGVMWGWTSGKLCSWGARTRQNGKGSLMWYRSWFEAQRDGEMMLKSALAFFRVHFIQSLLGLPSSYRLGQNQCGDWYAKPLLESVWLLVHLPVWWFTIMCKLCNGTSMDNLAIVVACVLTFIAVVLVLVSWTWVPIWWTYCSLGWRRWDAQHPRLHVTDSLQ